MIKSMRNLFLICSLFLLIINEVFSCVCGRGRPIQDYDYIALVEVLKIKKSNLYQAPKFKNIPPSPNHMFYEIEIKTLNHYCGEYLEEIIIMGGNEELQIGRSSCDMDIAEGEQWLIFGYNFKSKVATGYCTSSSKYQNRHGEKDYLYESAFKTESRIKEHFNIMTPYPEDGTIVKHYHNGNIELRESYYNGKANGERVVYYSNGQMMLLECFENGMRTEDCSWWYRDGTPNKECHYENDKYVGNCYYYRRNGTLMYIHHYTEHGDFIKSDTYDYRGGFLSTWREQDE